MKNVQPPREALKILLYHLFTMEELKTQSLKGVATKGASGNGLDKKRMAQLNSKFGDFTLNDKKRFMFVAFHVCNICVN